MATQNSPKFSCDSCDYSCERKGDFNKHLSTRKHAETTQNSQKNSPKLFCKNCNYICSRQSDFNKHILTAKHSQTTEKLFTCRKCKKNYKHHSSLWKHQANCVDIEVTPSFKDIILEMIKSNSELQRQLHEIQSEQIKSNNDAQKQSTELQKQVLEICKNGINTTNTNCNNKAFNINLFLNEQCKDAMNFSDFINGIEVSHEDLENNAQLGFVGGVSKILIDNLKLMNRNERPIHCTDVKRETMYIKDDNKWTKEEDDSKLWSAIQEITRKSIGTLMTWKRGNPESDDMDSKFSNRCIVIQQQSMAGFNRDVYYPKVIHAIAREVLVLK